MLFRFEASGVEEGGGESRGRGETEGVDAACCGRGESGL